MFTDLYGDVVEGGTPAIMAELTMDDDDVIRACVLGVAKHYMLCL